MADRRPCSTRSERCLQTIGTHTTDRQRHRFGKHDPALWRSGSRWRRNLWLSIWTSGHRGSRSRRSIGKKDRAHADVVRAVPAAACGRRGDGLHRPDRPAACQASRNAQRGVRGRNAVSRPARRRARTMGAPPFVRVRVEASVVPFAGTAPERKAAEAVADEPRDQTHAAFAATSSPTIASVSSSVRFAEVFGSRRNARNRSASTRRARPAPRAARTRSSPAGAPPAPDGAAQPAIGRMP